MIGLIDCLSSKINFVPSQKECMKLLNEFVTHDLFTNHYREIERVLTGFPKNEQWGKIVFICIAISIVVVFSLIAILDPFGTMRFQ